MRTVTESIWSIWGRTLAIVASLALVLTGPLGVAQAWAQQQGEIETTQDVGDDPADTMEVPDVTETAEEEEVEVDEADEGEEDEEDDEVAERLGDALGVTILGAASLVGGVVFLVESGDSSDLSDNAALAGDPLRAAELQDRSDREKALGITLTSLGIVLAGVSTWLWIDYVRERDAASAQADDDDDVTWQVTPSFDPRGGAGFVLGGRF